MEDPPRHLREISLAEVPGIVLIVPWRTSVVYVAETGGPFRHRAALEGFLVPLDVWWLGELATLFRSRNEANASPWELDHELADALDLCLAPGADDDECRALVVDRDRLFASREAWVHVVATAAPNSQSLVQGCEPLRGVLTWRNSGRP